MALYLRGQLHHIPQDIPKLRDQEAAKAIPDRLKKLKLQQEVQALDYGLDHRNSDENDLPWVHGKGTGDSSCAAGGGMGNHSPSGGLGNDESQGLPQR